MAGEGRGVEEEQGGGGGWGGRECLGVNMYLYIILNPPVILTKTTTYGNVLKNK